MITDILIRHKRDIEINQNNSKVLNKMVAIEKQYIMLRDDFKYSCIRACHLILKQKATPLNLFTLYGDDEEKYVAGGLFITKCKQWLNIEPEGGG